MNSRTMRMCLLGLVLCGLLAMVTGQGKEYLPPNKGYNYDQPSVPFPTTNQQPQYRPQPQSRPTYVPPSQPASHENHDHHEHHEPGMPFDFAYAVNENGNDFSHNAMSDGDVTRGEYRIALPDGRTQIVKYTADWKNGFNADVTYEGEASYPEPPAGGYGRGPAAGPSGPAPGPSGPGQAYSPGGGYQY